jgi:NAD(P)H-flavin reductase
MFMALTLDQHSMLADSMLPHPYRIQRIRKDTKDTFTFDLISPSGEAIPRFMPGQFNMLYVFGVGEVPISISGPPDNRVTLVHTIRAVGTVTQALQRLRRGDVVGVRGPFGSAWPIEENKGNDIVLVAGGIGLAPLRPVLYYILSHREQYGRVLLLYGSRTPHDLLYLRELEQWRGRFAIDVQVTVDSAASTWRGHVGVVTQFITRAIFDPASTVALICGPEVMMRFSAAEFHKRGLSAENLFISMERNMHCAVGFCGHCQFGPTFICKDGPVFRYDRIQPWFGKREV